jgi:threonine synthase
MSEWLQCIKCGTRFDAVSIRYTCDCGGLLNVERDNTNVGRASARLPLQQNGTSPSRETDSRAEARPTFLFDSRRASRAAIDQSGVWRFREFVMDVATDAIITHPEGSTRLYQRNGIFFKHEGENPTGSFKDRGMTVAITQARRVGARAVACASTGNTSASLAAYAAQAGMRAIVFMPSGKVSGGKIAQTLAYGATALQVRGDFDAAMQLVRESCDKLGIYLVNSINPFRIEGQKTIVWELLQDLEWNAPDWIVVPAGNLGNTSAFGKALREAHASGWIATMPRLASIQASGANPFFRSYGEAFARRHKVAAETIASAIRIGDPVSHDKAVDAIRSTNGIVEEVTDQELMAAKREIDEMGIGCEPASATTLAGVTKLRATNVMKSDERIVCVLTGHVLKDSDAALANVPKERVIEIDATISAVERALR